MGNDGASAEARSAVVGVSFARSFVTDSSPVVDALLEQARARLAAADARGCLAVLAEARAAAPDHPRVWEAHAKAFALLGRPHEAAEALARALDAALSAGLVLGLARLYDGVARFPDHAPLADAYAELLATTRHPAAAAAVERAAALGARPAHTAWRWMRLGLFERAERVLTDTREPEARAVAARLALWVGDRERAASEVAAAGDHPLARFVGAVLAGEPCEPGATSAVGPEPDAVLVWASEAHRRAGNAAAAARTGSRAMTSAGRYSVTAHAARLLGVFSGYADHRAREPSAREYADPWAVRSLAERIESLVADPVLLWRGRVDDVEAQLEGVLARFGGNRSAWPTVCVDGRW